MSGVRPGSGFVYAIAAGPFVKIGHSGSPCDRLRQIAQSAPYPCQLLGVMYGNTTTERDVQRRLSAWRAHGEWFHRDGEGVLAFVESLIKEPSIHVGLSAYGMRRDRRLMARG